MSAGAVCDGCGDAVSHDNSHYRAEARPPDSLLGFHNVTRYDLCSAACMVTLGQRLAQRDAEIDERIAAERTARGTPAPPAYPGEPTINLLEPCDGPGGPPLTARQLRRWWWRRQTAPARPR